jgi:ABC-type transport system involved in cytochrome c biogenesis permease component
MTRAFLSGIRIHALQFVTSAFDISGFLLWPILYASIAYYLFGAASDPGLLLSASLGAALMAMWASVIVGSGFTFENQRRQGTLELLVAAPVPLATILAPVTIATAISGVYSLVATVVWGRLLFGIPIVLEQPLAFAVAVPACVVAIGMLGLITAAAFVLYRAAFALGVSMQYPVWIASGLLVPLAILPGWVTPISWVLAPTWGFRAIRESCLGGTPWPDIGMCLVLSATYLAAALPFLQLFEYLARDRASLRLT